MLDLTVVVPIFNEQDNVEPLLAQLFAVLDGLVTERGLAFEVIAINDGSTDGSLARLKTAADRRRELRVVDFRRNYGQTAAIMAGIDFATGRIIVPIDADLQNDPADIPRLLEELDRGFDVVSGWRRHREDAPIRRNLVSRIANQVISVISGVRLRDYGCTLKAYRRDVIKDVRLYGEMHRFIPIYASWLGAKVSEIEVLHHPRRFGRSKYGLDRTIKVILDLIVVKFLDRYFTKPIYVFGGFGILSILLSFASFSVMIYLRIFVGISIILTPLPLLSAIAGLVGVMSLLMGLLAEIMVRTYFESQNRRVYAVREVVNLAERD